MTASGPPFYLLSHDDIAEQCLLTEAQYDVLLTRGDWPEGSAVEQVTLVTIDAFLAAVREAAP